MSGRTLRETGYHVKNRARNIRRPNVFKGIDAPRVANGSWDSLALRADVRARARLAGWGDLRSARRFQLPTFGFHRLRFVPARPAETRQARYRAHDHPGFRAAVAGRHRRPYRIRHGHS